MQEYIIRSSGSGKSTHTLSEADGAFAFIDKHGPGSAAAADSRPCIYWRPADLSHSVGFNPLENVLPG